MLTHHITRCGMRKQVREKFSKLKANKRDKRLFWTNCSFRFVQNVVVLARLDGLRTRTRCRKLGGGDSNVKSGKVKLTILNERNLHLVILINVILFVSYFANLRK